MAMKNEEKKVLVDELLNTYWQSKQGMLCKEAIEAKLLCLANELRNELKEEAK